MKKLFLDTNIVIDLLDKREPFCYDAVRLFTMAYNKKVQLLVSPMTYATASFLLRKHGTEEVRRLLNNFRLLSELQLPMRGLSMNPSFLNLPILKMPCSTILR